jgi:hypothetical protein
MHQSKLAIAGRRCNLQTHFRQLRLQPIAQQTIFLHWKTMPLWQWKDELISVVGMHGLIVDHS